MPKYIMLYRGAATDMSQMTQEQSQEEMDRWGAWMGKIGPALADPGAPFGEGASVVDDGSDGSPVELSGYTIVEADDMDAARALTDGHPYIREGEGNYAIDLFELIPMPMPDMA